jgi:hemolysin activation/secretion protein
MRTLLIILIIALPEIAFSATLDPSETRTNDYIFQQEQKALTREAEQEKLRKLLQTEPEDLGVKFPEKKLKTVTKTPTEKCSQIDKIIFSGDTIISAKKKAQLKAPYLNKCLTLAEIYNLVAEINNFYIKAGYVANKATLDISDLQKGTLTILIIEAVVEDIIFDEQSSNKHSIFNSSEVLTAFGKLKGKMLNLRDIEQGLEQLNRIKGSNATMKIIAGSSKALSKIVITRDKSAIPIGGSVTYDNSGSKATGEKKKKIATQTYNLFKLNDVFNLSYGEDTHNPKTDTYSQSLYTNLDLPFGYWNANMTYSHSRYQSLNLSSKVKGLTDSYNFKLSRAVLRGQRHKLGVNAAIKVQDTNSFENGDLLTVQTRKLSSAILGFNHRINSTIGTFLYGANYHRGTGWFDSEKDRVHKDYSQSTAEFEKLDFNINFYKPLQILEQNIFWSSTVAGQISNDALYSSERIYIGDQYSVRGFKGDSIAGNSGAYWSNEISSYLPNIFPDNVFAKQLANIQISTGYDIGFARKRGGKETEVNTGRGYVSGANIGLSYNSKYANFKTTYAKALTSPATLQAPGHVFYSQMSLVF